MSNWARTSTSLTKREERNGEKVVSLLLGAKLGQQIIGDIDGKEKTTTHEKLPSAATSLAAFPPTAISASEVRLGESETWRKMKSPIRVERKVRIADEEREVGARGSEC
jgi:hypothetical protein